MNGIYEGDQKKSLEVLIHLLNNLSDKKGTVFDQIWN